MITALLFLSGCTQKVTIKALEPAAIDRVTVTKRMAVLDFKYDRVGLASKIETSLASSRIENEPFFTMLSRENIHQVIREQKLQNSGLVELEDIVEVGGLIGAQALISGRVGKVSVNDTHHYETRSECADKKCKKLYYYDVHCTQRVTGLSADLKIVDVSKGDIIYADSFSRFAKHKHCRDYQKALPTRASVANSLALRIANDFTYKLTPHYKYFSVYLLEDPDLDYDDMQERLLKNALEYIKHSRFEKAETLLRRLINSTGEQSYVAFYNLGVVKEALGDYEKALSYYKKADDLAIEPVEEINLANVRLHSNIQKHEITQKQMSR